MIMMITFHLVWDINHFNYAEIELFHGFWKMFQIATASLFFLLVGVSINFSSPAKTLKRGVQILLLGMAITIITMFIFPTNFVVFGALHLIGFSVIVSFLFRDFRLFNLLLGAMIIISGVVIESYSIDFDGMFLIIFHSANFYSIDYFPVFPWFGVVLTGMFIGKILYANGTRRFELRELSHQLGVRSICFLGKKSLIIYLFHQVVLYGFFSAISRF